MKPAQQPPPDTLRYLLELLRQGQSLSEADRLFVDGILQAGNDSLTLRLQNLIGEALVRPLFTPRNAEDLKLHDVNVFSVSRCWQVAKFVLVEEFLTPQEVEALLDFTLRREKEFQASKIVLPGSKGARGSDYQRRKSKIMVDLQEHYAIVCDRIKAVLPWVFQQLEWPPFRVAQVEAQLTASNDGEFFKAHNDNTAEDLRSRELTFVYYFYREPKAFSGGELRLYETYLKGCNYVAGESCQTLLPLQNRIVFFPSCLVHEVLPIICPSRLFADSRFTVNGWLHSTQRRVDSLKGKTSGFDTIEGLPLEVS
jgi:Rps23 Pro-64 3,4-dihydroxylase Tpa1-like proline 4-hydroxylase